MVENQFLFLSKCINFTWRTHFPDSVAKRKTNINFQVLPYFITEVAIPNPLSRKANTTIQANKEKQFGPIIQAENV